MEFRVLVCCMFNKAGKFEATDTRNKSDEYVVMWGETRKRLR